MRGGRLTDDEALVIECDTGDAAYWSVQLYSTSRFEPADCANRVTSLNSQQVHVDDDGRVRIVLAPVDPGVQNWIDTCGYAEGLVSSRWVRPSGVPTSTSAVVNIADIAAHLLASTPTFSTEDRKAQIAQRRRRIARRFRY